MGQVQRPAAHRGRARLVPGIPASAHLELSTAPALVRVGAAPTFVAAIVAALHVLRVPFLGIVFGKASADAVAFVPRRFGFVGATRDEAVAVGDAALQVAVLVAAPHLDASVAVPSVGSVVLPVAVEPSLFGVAGTDHAAAHVVVAFVVP